MGETEGELDLVLTGRALLSKSSVQFYVNGWGCVLSLLFDLRPNYGGGNKDNCDLLQKVLCMHCYTQCPQPCSGPPPTHAPAGDSWTLIYVYLYINTLYIIYIHYILYIHISIVFISNQYFIMWIQLTHSPVDIYLDSFHLGVITIKPL